MDAHSGAAHVGVVAYESRGAAVPGRSSCPDGVLSSLDDRILASRFCAWRGVSERRYVASVYAVAREAADAGLPDFESFILMAVARGPLGRRILAVSAIERMADRGAALAFGLAQGADEWHVHFLAEDRRARFAMVADLRERHCGLFSGVAEARCA